MMQVTCNTGVIRDGGETAFVCSMMPKDEAYSWVQEWYNVSISP